MQKGELIGRGMTAEVYSWEQDKVLKLYFDWFPKDKIKYEAEISEAIHEACVPSPAVYDIVDEKCRKGIIYQHIAGKSMLKLIEKKPWKIFHYARQMARLHLKVHSCSIDKLPSQKERFAHAIKGATSILGDREKRILDHLERLPKSSSVCHGDFHPDNILITEKDMVAIDWSNAYSGNPLSDVARTYILIRTPFMPPGTSKIIVFLSKMLKWLLYSTYLKDYIRLGKVKVEDIEDWILPVASARLSEKIPGEEKWLLDIIDKRLNLLNR